MLKKQFLSLFLLFFKKEKRKTEYRKPANHENSRGDKLDFVSDSSFLSFPLHPRLTSHFLFRRVLRGGFFKLSGGKKRIFILILFCETFFLRFLFLYIKFYFRLVEKANVCIFLPPLTVIAIIFTINTSRVFLYVPFLVFTLFLSFLPF